jgi:hypothetical protein
MEGRVVNAQEVYDILERRMPKAFRYATANTLNKLAFEGRLKIGQVVKQDMTLRSKGFVRASTRYKKTRPISIDSQRAYFGTVEIPRSTAWIEQPKGLTDKRDRQWVRKARGRGGRGTVFKKYRFLAGRQIMNLSEAGGKLDRIYRRVYHFAWYDRPILIGKNDYGIKPGVVALKKRRKKMKMIRLANWNKNRRVKPVDIIGNSLKALGNRPTRYLMMFTMRQIKREMARYLVKG